MPNALDIGFSFPICIDILPERGAVESKEETMTSIQNDRTDETTVRRLLQQTSAAQPASRAKDDPRADDPNTIIETTAPDSPAGLQSLRPRVARPAPRHDSRTMRCSHTAGAVRKAQSSRPRSNSGHQANYARSPARP